MGIAAVPSVFCHPDLDDCGFAAERRNGSGHGYLAVLVGFCKPILRDFRLVGTPPLGAQSKLAAVCESQISPGHQLSRPDAPVHSGGPLGSPAGLVGTHWAANGCASAFMRRFFIMSLYR